MIVEKNIIDNFNKFSEILNTSLHPMVRGLKIPINTSSDTPQPQFFRFAKSHRRKKPVIQKSPTPTNTNLFLSGTQSILYD